jgi:hypothetical protein
MRANRPALARCCYACDNEQWLGLTTYQLFAPIAIGVD